MKKKFIWTILFTSTLLIASTAPAQRIEATSTVTTSEGTISEFGPQAVVIKTEAGAQPIRYISSETTNYVDENGNPVTIATLKSGLPVTVFYTKVGDTLLATKVMVRTGAAPVRTATTTQVVIPAATTQVVTPMAGVITEFGPENILIKTESSPNPLRYTYGKTTTYVDENGAPVTVETIKSGLPVTVYYTKVGDTLIANKVVVRRSVAVPSPVIEEKTTTTTTTTTRK
ncbi:MAG TPA: hypothetical protein DDZ88_27480 [Verrucomicrobiales bacterium]|nr:hypothetical protein [Verrucomicrobiales bacterium]